MILAKQLDLPQSMNDAYTSTASTPRTNLAKELEKYNRPPGEQAKLLAAAKQKEAAVAGVGAAISPGACKIHVGNGSPAMLVTNKITEGHFVDTKLNNNFQTKSVGEMKSS